MVFGISKKLYREGIIYGKYNDAAEDLKKMLLSDIIKMYDSGRSAVAFL